ncbi:hypothetical protein, partial [Methylobacterium oryzihabitans]|uniref:hypothetical protein n=1 Tax=Methylobacterium oryzihabitans TaxID=2499852 RepID=UPI001AED5194
VGVLTPVVAPLTLDRLRIARTGADLVWFSPTDAVVTARLGAAFGLDGLGARAAPPPGRASPRSRARACGPSSRSSKPRSPSPSR